jgi:DNA-binding CsgD family transcriptional regulator
MTLAAIDHLVLGVVFIDHDGRALAMNRSAARTFAHRSIDGKIAPSLIGECGRVAFDGLVVLVCPIGVMPLVDGAAAVLFVADPDVRIEAIRERLGELYGLTAAEARVAGELLRGLSVEEIATSLRVSKQTVRTQLRRIFGKTGTGRQGELIRLLLTGPASQP